MEAVTIESPLTNFQQAALEVAEKELAELRIAVGNMKYLIDLDKKDLAILDTFLKVDAKWLFTESLGIIETEKAMKAAMKEGKLFTDAPSIQAIYYFLSKVEGNGRTPAATSFNSIEDFVRILKAIKGGIDKIKIENEKVDRADFIVSARREGIEPDASIIKSE